MINKKLFYMLTIYQIQNVSRTTLERGTKTIVMFKHQLK